MEALLSNGVVVFGLVIFVVAMPLAWVLEKLGIMEVPAPSLREVTGSRTSRSEVPAPSSKNGSMVTGSSHRNSAGARVLK